MEETSNAAQVMEKKTVEDFVPPKKWNVIFINDDITPIGFVTFELVNEYGMSESKAISKAIDISNSGQGVVGTYFYAIAEAKRNKTRKKAREMGYPLEVDLEISQDEE